MKETIVIQTCIPSTGKSGKPFHKLNGNIFIWDKEMGRKLEDNIGKAFDLEIDRGSNFPKVLAILSDSHPEVPTQAVSPYQVVKEEIKQEASDNEVILKKDKPNSYEFGKAGNRFKVYFNSPEDLEEQVKALMEMQNSLFPLE